MLYFGEKFRIIVLIIALHKKKNPDNSELPESIYSFTHLLKSWVMNPSGFELKGNSGRQKC